jgi:hypothetical protein
MIEALFIMTAELRLIGESETLGQGFDLLETRGWVEVASGVVET